MNPYPITEASTRGRRGPRAGRGGGGRFQRLRDELGPGFAAVEIDSGPGNPFGTSRLGHSVVTNDLVDKAGHPTRAALDAVLTLFRERLLLG